MPLVKAICTNCGGSLEVDSSKEAAVCPFCKQAYIVEKAITNYNNTYVNNISHADVVNIYGDQAKDFVIKGGVLTEYKGEAVEVTVPDNVKVIGQEAFQDTAVERVVFPKGLREIRDWAFKGCTKLREVNFPQTLELIDKGAFKDCTNLGKITIPKSTLVITNRAFEKANIQQLILPENTVSIAENEQYSLSLSSAGELKEFPKNQVSLFEDAFVRAKIEQLTTPVLNVRFDGVKHIRYIPNTGNSIGGFMYNKHLAEFVIPDWVTEICDDAFRYCANLKSIVIPAGVTEIGKNAFEGCISLENVVIPEGVTSIKGSAFYGCTSLKSIIIPEGVTSIEGSAFYGCTSLSEVKFPKSLMRIEPGAFAGDTSLPRRIVIPNSKCKFSETSSFPKHVKVKHPLF